jgi:hypothetical protein
MLLVASLALVALGCESAASSSHGGSDGDTDTDTDTDTDVDTDADSDTDTDTDTDGDGGTDTDVCDELDFDIELAPVNLMILQDMSFSMSDPEVASPTNWTYAVPALNTILTDWAGSQIVFGFDIFPDGSAGPFTGCRVDDPVLIDCAADTETAIMDYINDSGNDPNGASTPLYCAMADFIEAGYAPLFNDASANRYLLVVTDGEDFCGEGCCSGFGAECTATPDEFAALATGIVAAGIKIVVIGFGSGVMPDELNAIAGSGGMEAPFDQYLIATDTTSLESALTEIANAVITCVYNIGSPDASADPNDVNFYFDDVVVGYDEGCALGAGWTWANEEHTQVEFCAAACAELQGGLVETISATWGCPTIPIE